MQRHEAGFTCGEAGAGSGLGGLGGFWFDGVVLEFTGVDLEEFCPRVGEELLLFLGVVTSREKG